VSFSFHAKRGLFIDCEIPLPAIRPGREVWTGLVGLNGALPARNLGDTRLFNSPVHQELTGTTVPFLATVGHLDTRRVHHLANLLPCDGLDRLPVDGGLAEVGPLLQTGILPLAKRGVVGESLAEDFERGRRRRAPVPATNRGCRGEGRRGIHGDDDNR